MKYLRTLAERVRTATRSLRRVIDCTRHTIKRWWRSHRKRMAQEPSYADAFLSVVLATVELITESSRSRYIAHELSTAYVAVLRALHPQLGGDGWS